MNADGGTWLCPDDQARARILDNSRRIRRARTTASVAVGIALIYVAPSVGYWLLAIFALSLLNTSTVDLRMRRSRRPEYQSALTSLISMALIAIVAALTGGPKSEMLSLIVVPTAFFATRFRPAVCFVATLIAVAMVLIAAFAVSPHDTISHPKMVITAIVVLIGVNAAMQALFGAEIHHRKSAILDPLTGLLNRQGLERRFDELAEQARLVGAPVSLLICDIDHFKLVNDLHGHATGDAVLRDVAYALRKQLRSFELIYRLGGEEFLVLLPGATPDSARALAERLCEAVRSCDSQGLRMSISIGVATQWGHEIYLHTLFDAADRALYKAKTAGRDRVISAPAQQPDEHGAAAPKGAIQTRSTHGASVQTAHCSIES